MNENTRDVLGLLKGLETGELVVKSYSSRWIMKGIKPTNQRKMTIVIEEANR